MTGVRPTSYAKRADMIERTLDLIRRAERNGSPLDAATLRQRLGAQRHAVSTYTRELREAGAISVDSRFAPPVFRVAEVV